MFRFIHAADIHLDSPLRGLEQYEGAPVEQIRGATRRALENLVALAIREEVAFVVLSGDLYDGDWKDFNTGIFFARQMARLKEAGISVFLISGNHDAASQITRHLTMPDNVKWFGASKPESFELESLGVALHGQSYETQAVTSNLVHGYPKPVRGAFNIGLLHTSIDGREGHDSYAPTTVDQLRATEYDYWALGHVHKPETLSKNPWIVFPGNTQGRHVKETGSKGCVLVTVQKGQVSSVTHEPLDVVRWLDGTVGTSSPLSTLDDACREISTLFADEVARRSGRLLAIRLRLHLSPQGYSSMAGDIERWESECRRLADEAGEDSIWISRVEPVLPAEEELLGVWQNTSLSDLPKDLAAIGMDVLSDEGLRKELKTFSVALPPALKVGEASLDLVDPSVCDRSFQDAKRFLVSLLSGRGDRR